MDKMDDCQCGARIIRTSITMSGNLWKVEYTFGTVSNTLQEMMAFETDDLEEIKFPPTLGCPDNCP